MTAADVAAFREQYSSLPDGTNPPNPPSWVQLQSILPLRPDVERITNLSADTIMRRHGHLVVQLSERRRGMSLRNALRIAAGQT